jgi:RNA-binding protein 25
VIASNGVHKSRDEEAITAMDIDPKPNNNNSAPRKLGFGLMGSGRRATVPSVFNHEDEEEAPDLNKLRQLVPIDYSAEEMQVVALPSSSVPAVPPSRGIASNLAAATEFVKSLALMPTAKADGDRERSRRSREKSGEREKTRRDKDRDKEKDRDRDAKRVTETEPKAPGAKKIVDAKQLIDTIPKTKEELFGYPVDWLIYDKHELHEKMRPWISKKITEFLGEEETTLVDFIVSNTRKHVPAASMLELLESILDDEAEMFVLKMWRMLIFEIRRVETGLASNKHKS